MEKQHQAMEEALAEIHDTLDYLRTRYTEDMKDNPDAYAEAGKEDFMIWFIEYLAG